VLVKGPGDVVVELEMTIYQVRKFNVGCDGVGYALATRSGHVERSMKTFFVLLHTTVMIIRLALDLGRHQTLLSC
jgi:hypothetical protein